MAKTTPRLYLVKHTVLLDDLSVALAEFFSRWDTANSTLKIMSSVGGPDGVMEDFDPLVNILSVVASS